MRGFQGYLKKVTGTLQRVSWGFNDVSSDFKGFTAFENVSRDFSETEFQGFFSKFS